MLRSNNRRGTIDDLYLSNHMLQHFQVSRHLHTPTLRDLCQGSAGMFRGYAFYEPLPRVVAREDLPLFLAGTLLLLQP